MKILVVCLGNICRSPAAEVILREKAKGVDLEAHIESCGIGDWHVGQRAHHRMIEAAGRRGLQLDGRAKQFKTSYFEEFDLILAADQSVFDHLISQAPDKKAKEKVRLYTHFSSSHQGKDVPDPYFGGEEMFDEVLDMLDEVLGELALLLKQQN